jgi:hypothetical protein
MMAATIWKYILKPADEQIIPLPEGAEILCAREQDDNICVWVRCFADKRKLDKVFFVAGTGHNAPAEGRYIGTAMLAKGALVFHVFVLD